MSRFLPTVLTTSPHIKGVLQMPQIMGQVALSLVPIALFAIWNFGLGALAVLLTSTVGCVLTEKGYNRLTGARSTTGDYSAVVTGILLGLTLPPAFPLWMVLVGCGVSIVLGKMIFGGVGNNPFNPALVGRAFLQTAFPAAITTWSLPLVAGRFAAFPGATFTLPFLRPTLDGLSGATPLAAFKFEGMSTEAGSLLWGTVAGSAGETSALLILLCGGYLALRGLLDWRIPAGILGSAYLLSAVLHFVNPAFPPPLFTVLSGGLVLGAVYMATDMVSSPITPWAVWIYGVFIGFTVVVIRVWGGLPEGVMYAILLGNALVPLLNRAWVPRVFGTGRRP